MGLVHTSRSQDRVGAIALLLILGASQTGCALIDRTVQTRAWDIPSVRDHLPAALESAKSWEEDAHLVWSEVWLDPDPHLVFAFGSLNNPSEGLLAHIEDPMVESHVQLEEVPAPGRTEALPAIEPAAWDNLDSADVFSIALANGGAEFLEIHSETDTARIQLRFLNTPSGGGVAWRVTLGDPLGQSYDVVVDAKTGEVLRTEESQ